METQIIIQKILAATMLEEVLDVHHLEKEYKKIMLQIHPDICREELANDATTKINTLKEAFEKKRKEIVSEYYNDAGSCIIKDRTIIQYGDLHILQRSIDNYNILKRHTDTASIHFHRYLPKKMEIIDNALHITLEHRSVSLSCLILPPEHVHWILSRMLEFTGWLEKIGYVHCDLNPESILVVPETHGVIITSFFYLAKANDTLTSISERYSFWYDERILADRKAKNAIDIQLCKKIAIYLLGDISGSGTELFETQNRNFMNFVTTYSSSAINTYEKYREMLRENFDTKKYHPLYI